MSGEIVNIKLRIDPEYQSFPNAPSIQEFSRNDIKAKNPCLASERNSPDSREGVLLFSSCSPDGKTRAGLASYIARWAVVLAADSESPDPIFGFGRMAIRKDTAPIRQASAIINNPSASEEDKARAREEAENPKNFIFPAILYYAEEMIVSSDNEARADIEKAIESHHGHGITGGCLVRIPGTNYAKEIFLHYKASDKQYQTGREAADTLLLEMNLAPGQTIEIIPVARINSGPKGNKHYGTESNYRAIKKLYYQDLDTPQICEVVARVTRYEDTDNTLLYRLYAISSAVANQHTIGVRANIGGRGERSLNAEKCLNVTYPATPEVMGRGEAWRKILSPVTFIEAEIVGDDEIMDIEDSIPAAPAIQSEIPVDSEVTITPGIEVCRQTPLDPIEPEQVEKKAPTGMAAYLARSKKNQTQ